MQLSIFLLAVLLYGCTPHGTDNSLFYQTAAADSLDHKAVLDDNGVVSVDDREKEGSILLKIKNFILDGYGKLLQLLGVKQELSSYCRTILESSPTAADFIKNWGPDDKLVYCSNDDTSSCKKKHDDAFQKGLLCYQAL